MGIAGVIQKLQAEAVRLGRSSGAMHPPSAPRPTDLSTTYPTTYPSATVLHDHDLQDSRIGRVGYSQLCACAGAHVCAHMRIETRENLPDLSEVDAIHSQERDCARIGRPATSPDLTATYPPPRPATVLKHCRCMDCRHWIGEPHSECVHGIIRNGVKPVPEYPADAWHWCALYHGPQVSKDVWVWPKVTPQAAQVGAGSNIPAKPGNPTADPGKRDVAQPRVNGSFPRTYGGDRGGNSRAPVLCLFDRRT